MDIRQKFQQQYFDGSPQSWYYVNCGINEPLLVIWFDDERNKYFLSHETTKSIKDLTGKVLVKKLENVELSLILRGING